ncbi:uncharacterized protein A1O9_10955 [Exophiala aquamarina CBS 119918]|uniref:DUF1989 domain-containing protein n=1 Tax=Exophiala aquamarina CBS 119918 TaxID=1182545 RepID=A0A072P044_9EURO|nr:uncharacterized protein A1O9_10955 [Exophiala aquamarina CBS 119918]KEF53047.1 hypothetical protein A1O9_10955 [Exophiala aquamarina CBS 119918]
MAAVPTAEHRFQIPARSGVAVELKQKQTIKIVNTHGNQVIDFWAVHWISDQHPAFLSMSHSRGASLHLSPLVGDILVTNARAPLLKLVEDTTPGVHDTLIAACDPERYRQLGAPSHANCADNFFNAIKPWGVERKASFHTPPDPLNLFMNIPVLTREAGSQGGGHEQNPTAGGEIKFEAPLTEKGQFVVFEALDDAVIVMSACPQDLVNVNNGEPTEAHFEISG